jgi:hypothetical protein
MIANRNFRSIGALVVTTLATLTAVLIGTHYADAAMVKPASTTTTTVTAPRSASIPASCKAMIHLPAYELPASKDNAILGMVSGTEVLRDLLDAKLSNRQMARECNAYLYQWSADHPKAV